MILRKLTRAIAEQNWFTVALEVLIVVVGIFAGLQVDDWNEARKDRAREAEFLDRIDAELVLDIGEFDRSIALAQTRAGDVELILASLADPTLPRRDPTNFVRAIVRAGFTYSAVISDHTFEEIKSAGELGIVRDVELRASITRYYQQRNQTGQWDYLREMNQTEYLKRQVGIVSTPHLVSFSLSRAGTEVTPEEASAAFERMRERPEYIDWLPFTLSFLLETRELNREAKSQAAALRAAIAEAN